MMVNSKKLSRFIPEKDFWIKVFKFSLPIGIQNMSAAILGIIDVSVISKMGENAVAAVSLANQLFYIVSLITFGITSGASVYLARSYGCDDAKGFKETFSITIFFSLIVNFIIALLCAIWPQQTLYIFTDDFNIIKDGAIYLLIITPTFLLYSISNSCCAFFRSVGKPETPMVTTTVSLVVKVILNYIFIYGWGFIPAMGVAGAALGTLVSKIVETAMYMFEMCRYKYKEYVFAMKDIIYFKAAKVSSFLKRTYSVILNESLWGLGISAFNTIFGRMGTVAVNSYSIARQLENLGNSFFYGISIGACVTISYLIGQKKYEEAEECNRKYSLVGFYTGIGIMVLMMGISVPYVKIFFSGLSAETQNSTVILICIYAVYMPFRSLASTLIMGAMRAGGDSRNAMIYDVAPVYLWSLPIGFILGIYFKLPIHIVLAVMMFKRFIKCALALHRVKSKKWINYNDID